ncbi:MAG: radical SAM protein, partial [Pseudomonadota bacterium]
TFILVSKTYQEQHLIKNLVRMTLKCNAGCVFCNIPPESEPGFTEPDAQTVLDQVRAAVRASGGQGIVLSGGEPMMRRVTLKAAEEARKQGAAWVEIQTNGLLVDKKAAAAMAGAGIGKALVAVLSAGAAHHDRLTGVKGSWKKTIASIHNMTAAGIEVILNLLMTGPTVKTYTDLLAFAMDEFPFVREVNFSAVSATGRCSGRPDLWPDFDDARPVIRESLALAGARGVRCLNPFCGLPVCVGWENDLDRCVEAQEMKAARMSGRSLADVEGLKNEGEKLQPALCLACAYRTMCGGIWRRINEVRGVRGLEPPEKILRRFPAGHWPEPGKRADARRNKALILELGGPAGMNPAESKSVLKKEKKTCGQVTFLVRGTGLPDGLADAARCALHEGYRIISVAADAAALSDRGRAVELAAAGVTEFALVLRSLDASKNDALAAAAGNFRNSVRGLANLEKIRDEKYPVISIVLATVLIPQIVSELEGFAALCRRLGIREMFILPPSPADPPAPSASAVAKTMKQIGSRAQPPDVMFRTPGLPRDYGIPSYGEDTIAFPVPYPKK